jgi:replicative DNA helicase
MGKTSFVLNVAANVAQPRGRELASDPNQRWEDPGHGVVIFSLEMPREQLANRMICSEGRVDVGKVRGGFLGQGDWNKLTQAAAHLGSLPIWIDDSPSLSILELRAKVRRLQAEYDKAGENGKTGRKIGLVVVDYLQLMKGRDNVNSREQEISEISRGLKGLAKELRLSVIALSQLNRAVETRTEKHKRPQLSDLRESGAIEQDADNICFIYRDDYYNKEASTEPNIAELIIAKQRNGPTGTARVRFDREYTRFDNLAESDYPADEEG